MQRTDNIASPASRLAACHCCGLVQRVPTVQRGYQAFCYRCHSPLRRVSESGLRSRWAAVLSLAAFLCYWPAILLPLVEIERLGQRNRSSLLEGVLDLIGHGDWFVGGVVFVFSIVFPLVKIGLLLDLSLLRLLHRQHQALTYRVVEFMGRWSMLDVLLLALLVMLVKMKTLLSFHLGPAVYAFSSCVALGMIASMVFDPHAMWDETE